MFARPDGLGRARDVVIVQRCRSLTGLSGEARHDGPSRVPETPLFRRRSDVKPPSRCHRDATVETTSSHRRDDIEQLSGRHRDGIKTISRWHKGDIKTASGRYQDAIEQPSRGRRAALNLKRFAIEHHPDITEKLQSDTRTVLNRLRLRVCY